MATNGKRGPGARSVVGALCSTERGVRCLHHVIGGLVGIRHLDGNTKAYGHNSGVIADMRPAQVLDSSPDSLGGGRRAVKVLAAMANRATAGEIALRP